MEIKRDIEKSFFELFSWGGAMHICFDWIEKKYDLYFYCSREEEGTQEVPEEQYPYYSVGAHFAVYRWIDSVEDSVVAIGSPLYDEISTNIDRLNGKEKDIYIFSLLEHFKEYSDTLNPIERIERLQETLNKRLESNPQENIEGCKYAIERVKYIAKEYNRIGSINSATDFNSTIDIIDKKDIKEKTIENYFCYLKSVVERFAINLDALLLKRGKNLMWYQKESGIYILTKRNFKSVGRYCGGEKLARKYIDYALPKIEPQQEKLTEKEFLSYGKAIKRGMAEKTENGYKWLYKNGSLASLAYFINKIFNSDGTGRIPYKRLQRLWNVNRLDSAVSRLFNAKGTQEWEKKIDELFKK